MIQLPDKFKKKMKDLLKEEYDSFMKSYDSERVQGLRVNPLKVSLEEFCNISPFSLKKIPWAAEGYYYQAGQRPGKHPYHEAGLYYIQEPSAMAAAELLDPQPGEKVLDLCAAPGGKTTHIAGRMQGKGLLVSNEIHPARAKILSQNVERMGVGNTVVTNEDSKSLSLWFPEFFDRILVDAPCSGEGMFRKDEKAIQEWSPDHVKACGVRQLEILSNGAVMLKPGGTLVYSTCTFSPEENEQVIESFLLSHPEFSVKDMGTKKELCLGCPAWSKSGNSDLEKTFRIWPHRLEGEGHYLAVLKKDDGVCNETQHHTPDYIRDQSLLKELREFLNEFIRDHSTLLHRKEYVLFGDQVYLVAPEMIQMNGLKILRPGLHMGTLKKNRFEPSHALALYLKKEQVNRFVDLPVEGEEIIKYLKGQTLTPDSYFSGSKEKGWVLVNAGGYSIGFAKLAGGILKNHYPKGLRWLE